MRKQEKISTVLIVLNLALIWGNSLLPGSASGAMSGGEMEFVMELLRIPEEHAPAVHLFVRKAAHFTEFACLGALLCWRFRLAGERRWHLPVLCGMAAALVDETIQMFSPDRGPSLVDVWIDTAGAAAGMILLLCGYHVIKRIKNKT
ncbi:MAG: VanZ family protein [Oscillospiraceae bacterium]|nr:VanZ family protein [Oscillospiraceae bacterium]